MESKDTKGFDIQTKTKLDNFILSAMNLNKGFKKSQ